MTFLHHSFSQPPSLTPASVKPNKLEKVTPPTHTRLAVLGTECRDSCILGKSYTTIFVILFFCVSVFSVPQALFEENENIAQSPEELWVQARMAPCLT